MWGVPSEKNSRGLLLCMLAAGVPFVSLERQFANKSFALENLLKHFQPPDGRNKATEL